MIQLARESYRVEMAEVLSKTSANFEEQARPLYDKLLADEYGAILAAMPDKEESGASTFIVVLVMKNGAMHSPANPFSRLGTHELSPDAPCALPCPALPCAALRCAALPFPTKIFKSSFLRQKTLGHLQRRI